MEWSQLLSLLAAGFTGLVTIICAIIWYIMRSIIADLHSVEQEVSTHRLHVSENYAKKDDVKIAYDTLIAYLDEMRSTINRIAVDMAAKGVNNQL